MKCEKKSATACHQNDESRNALLKACIWKSLNSYFQPINSGGKCLALYGLSIPTVNDVPILMIGADPNYYLSVTPYQTMDQLKEALFDYLFDYLRKSNAVGNIPRIIEVQAKALVENYLLSLAVKWSDPIERELGWRKRIVVSGDRIAIRPKRAPKDCIWVFDERDESDRYKTVGVLVPLMKFISGAVRLLFWRSSRKKASL